MKCKASTAKGSPCSKDACKDSVFCTQHKPKVDRRNKEFFPEMILKYTYIQDKLKCIENKEDLLETLKDIDELRNEIDKSYKDYIFYVNEDVIEDFKYKIMKYMKYPERIQLVIDYIFIFDSRDLSVSFTEYGFPELYLGEDLDYYIAVHNYRFRGYEKDSPPLRAKLKPDDKLNTKIPILNLKDFPEICFKYINETYNYNDLLMSIRDLREHIEKFNIGYDYEVHLNVLDYCREEFRKYIDSKRRLELILSYIFIYKGRDFKKPIHYYACNPKMNKLETKFVESFLPRNLKSEGSKAPKTNRAKSPEGPKSESSKVPKSSGTESSKRAKSPEAPKAYSIYEELKKQFPDKNIDLYLKIIKTSTVNLKTMSKEEIMSAYRAFHPDKCGDNKKIQELCNLVSSKLSVIKKQNTGSSSPVRPIGDLSAELLKILRS